MKTISLIALKTWLDQIAAKSALIAPRWVDGVLLYRSATGSDQIVFDYSRPKMSAKEAVLPHTEQLFTIEKEDGNVRLMDAEPARKQVIFGLRPCDAHGIAVLDSIFIKKTPADLAYARQRDQTILVGLACPQMWEGCFCTSMGGAPDDPTHLDILLTQIEGGYEVKTVTEKGRQLLAGAELQEVSGERDRAVHEAGVTPPPTASWPARFTDRYWELLAERCIGCRVCAYVCPTCRCFDVRDQVVEQSTQSSRYERLRCWDSCMGNNYRLTAGGHNSRPTKASRLRNRFYCKFYYVPQDYGPTACVGCGRCIESCPVNIDIVEVLKDLRTDIALLNAEGR